MHNRLNLAEQVEKKFHRQKNEQNWIPYLRAARQQAITRQEDREDQPHNDKASRRDPPRLFSGIQIQEIWDLGCEIGDDDGG